MKRLECSSAGDKRFSAFYARVSVDGVCDSIEHHYQNCKRDRNGSMVKKGAPVHSIVIKDKVLPATFLTPFYKALWYKYFRTHPELLEVIAEYDEFTDKYRGKCVNCQADVIKEIRYNGLQSIRNDDKVKQLFQLLKEDN